MFFKTFKVKFIIYLIPLILLTSFAFLFFYLFRSDYVIKEGLTNLGFRLVKDLSYSSQLTVSIEESFLLHPGFVEAVFEEKDVGLVAVYDKRGNIILSKSRLDIKEQIPQDVLEEVLAIRTPLKKISQSRQGETIYDFYAPILIKEEAGSVATVGSLVGFVRISLGLEKIKTEKKEAISLGLFIAGLVVLLGFFVSFLLAERLARPIKLFAKGTEEIARGNLDYRFEIKTGDEIERLARNFNYMAKSLKRSRKEIEEARDVLEIKVKARTRELQEQAEGLDEQVKERTKELQEQIDELERFHRLTVGRELKMIELKKQIQELEREIKPRQRKKGINRLTKKTKKS